jgi:hypothetical protein
MTDGHATWPNAAACTTASPQPARFGDLPREQRKDIVRLGFLSAIAFAYTLAMAILAQPIPSRSLHPHSALPHGAVPRSPLMEALLVPPPVTQEKTVAARRPAHAEPVLRPVAVPDPEATNPQARMPRKGNAFSRFFKGIWRTVS